MNSEGHKLNNNERRSGSIWHTVIPEHRFFNSLATSTSQLDRKLHNSIRRHSPTIQTSLINTLDSNVHNPQSPDSLPQTLGNGDLIRPPLHNGLAEKNPYRRSRNPKSSTTCRSFCLSVCRNYYVRRPIFLVLLSLTFLGSHMVIFYKYFAPYLAGAHPIPTSESRNGLASAISRDKFIPESIFSTPSGNDNTEEWAKGEEFPDDLLRSAQFRPFAPLRPIDKEKFTVRINTWRRNELLVASVNHHTSCEGVAQVQIVWNDPESGPPGELLSHKSGLVVIEDHTQVNSLNERFNVKTENPPTVGILNVDDDVFYPCEALDAGFFMWTRSPERIVGYDKRLHNVSSEKWEYGTLSFTKKKKMYSMTLTRYCFIHIHYLSIYMRHLPKEILNFVDENKNCEDIAMTFLVSSLTNGQAPLLTEEWALRLIIKLQSDANISGGIDHMELRDYCTHNFARILGLHPDQKTPLQTLPLPVTTFDENDFQRFFSPEPPPEGSEMTVREQKLRQEIDKWAPDNFKDKQRDIINRAIGPFLSSGLVRGTIEFLHRFWNDDERTSSKKKLQIVSDYLRYSSRDKDEYLKEVENYEQDPLVFLRHHSMWKGSLSLPA